MKPLEVFKCLLPSISFFLLSCAEVKPKKLDIHPAFQRYIASFEQDSRTYGKPVKIDNLVFKFGALPSNTLARCYLQSTPEIVFNPVYYDQFIRLNLYSDLELVVYHELGHCVLFRMHEDTRSGLYRLPASIMNTYHFAGQLYQAYKHNYLKELFLNVPNNFEE
jgi:hypothetical protein